MKKIVLLCAVLVLVCAASFSTAKAGTAGSDNGFTWNEDGVLISYTGTDTEITIPSNITAIADKVFQSNNTITKVTIPSNVKVIGEYAFAGCQSLKTVICSSETIGTYAFNYCQNLISVSLDSNVKKIEYGAFSSDKALKSIVIPDSVTDMGDYVFTSCESLETVILSKNLKSFGGNNFRYCYSLLSAPIAGCQTEIPEYAFSGCSSLKSVVIPDSVSIIGNSAFSSLLQLESVYIGAGVTEIGDYAFNNCSSLSSVTFAEGAECTLGNASFAYCYALTSLTIPGRVKSIGMECFWYSPISSLVIEDGVETIGSQAFCNNKALTSLTLPKSIKNLEYCAFGYCDNLETVILEEGLSGLGDQCFTNCVSLKEIYIPGSVGTIGNCAFSSCTALKKVVVGEGVTEIEYGAFSNCDSLETVTLPSTLADFSLSIIDSSPVKAIYVSKGTGTCRGTSDGQVLILGNTLEWMANTDIPIPADVDTISGNIYFNDENLVNFVLPSNIRYIENGAFSNCSNLETIILPEGLLGIGDAAFYGCTKLNHVFIPEHVESIGIGVFENCSELNDFSVATTNHCYSFEGQALVELATGRLLWGDIATFIPSNVILIENSAFSACDTHTILSFPDGLRTVNGFAFFNCPLLERIILPDSVTTIQKNAFYACGALVAITIPSGVTTLERNVIYGCNRLSYVTIPKGVTSIDISFSVDSGKPILIVYKDSFAEQFAKNYKYTYYYVYEGNALKFTDYALSVTDDFNLYIYTDEPYFSSRVSTSVNALLTYPDGRTEYAKVDTGKAHERMVKGEGLYYPYVISFAAKEINDEVTIQMVQGNTNIPISEPFTFSVKKYCEDLCALDTTTDDMKDFVKAILTYGTYAQLYFDYRTDDLALPTSECNLSNIDTVKAALSEYADRPVISGTMSEGISFYGSSLVLSSSLIYRMYYLTEDAWMIRNYNLQKAGEGIYYSDVDTLSIAEFGKNRNAGVAGASISYNPLSYIKRALDGDYSDSLKDLCIALYDYYQAGQAYLAVK